MRRRSLSRDWKGRPIDVPTDAMSALTEICSRALERLFMPYTQKLSPGFVLPSLVWPRVGGGFVAPSEVIGWRLLSVYRGRHCPLCKSYFQKLEGMLGRFAAASVSVLAVSADSEAKAAADVAEHGWSFPVGYDLTVDQMRSLGLYISEPRSPQETDRPFAEPGLFVINPMGALQIVDLSNAPFARPDLDVVLSGIKLIQERNYPIRGTMS